ATGLLRACGPRNDRPGPRDCFGPAALAMTAQDSPPHYFSSVTATDRPLVVGTGIAGLWTAWRLASEGHRVLLVTKATLQDSNTAWAQGGIAVAMDAGDSPALHAADTIAASDGLADPTAVEVLVTEGPARVRELLELGAAFDRGPDGELRFGLEAAHSRPRILHAEGDRTGAAL